MDIEERARRSAVATELIPGLAEAGVVGVATTFVDNAGIARVKSVPLGRLPHLAAWGAGFSTSFDRFRDDDQIAVSGDGTEPVGDLRLMPDLDRLVRLSAQPGWAWAPADRYAQTGLPHRQCSRLLLRRVTEALAQRGITASAALEIEWVISAGDGDDFAPAVAGPGYGMARLIDRTDYCRDLLVALADEGVQVEQLHPEYAAGQLELSVSPEPPVGAADTSVLVRSTIRAIGARHGVRTSFAPKVAVPGVGNGGHLHVSIWRDGRNLMNRGSAPSGLTEEGEGFSAGILSRLPALLALGVPSPAGYLRLLPSHWAGDYACWGVENREAALRMVLGSVGSEDSAANLEIKCFDLTANPYLLLAGVLAAGAAGLDDMERLPEPVDVDPAVLDEQDLARRGITRLPTTLAESADALAADDVLGAAFGADLVESIVAVRRSDIERFEGATDEEIAAATRWQH